MLYIFLTLLLLLFLLLYYPLEVRTHFRRKQADDLFLIEIVIIPKLWIHRIEIPIIKLETGKVPSLKIKSELENPNNETMANAKLKLDFSWENIRHIIENILPYYKLIHCYFKSGKLFFRPWVIKSFSWNTSYGLGDAALTGISSGMLWTFKIALWHQISTWFKVLERPLFKVQPDFSERKFEVEIDGIFGCRLGNIIIAGINAWLNLRTCGRKE